MYHTSDLKKFVKCNKLYFLEKDNENIYKPYLRNDESVSEILISFFGPENYYRGIIGDPAERFFEEEGQYEWFFSARFESDDLRIKIPVMHKTQNGYDIYFVYYGTSIKELDLFSYRASVEIIEKKGIDVASVNVIYFNPEYVYHDHLEPKKLLLICDTYKKVPLYDALLKKDSEYKETIAKMESTDPSEISPVKCRACRAKNNCEHYYECFPDELNIEDNSILTLVSSQYKNEMYQEGIRYLKDADLNRVEGNRIQYAQIMADRNGGLFVDRCSLNCWMSSFISKPISFVDFEWDRYLVPPYEGMKPLDVLCFEFVLYYIDENGKMEHRTFVGTHDCREDFIKALIDYMPKTGPVLAYNAFGAESLRLRELAAVFPQYAEELLDIDSRFVDLAVPFIEGMVYDTRMKGNFTLKKLVDCFSDYSYSNLDIYDGMGAVYSWRNVDKGNADEKGEEKILSDLVEYCSLDAYGLFLVYRYLISLLADCNIH